ncbi:MAG TPA: tetratricopeptide repeat protein [Vicinamibacterales bacterium]|nr:tetratricopeptide repeat protein [Vicinamibacterales bacterium]
MRSASVTASARLRKLLLVTIVFLSACAPKTVPAPVVTAPKFPEFMRPTVPPALADGPAAAAASRGWAFLQSGDFKTAEREFGSALKAQPAFYPAETSLGYLELARKDAKAALPHFDRALELNGQKDDVSAFLGRATALMALNRESEALSAFESALAADPSQTELARRVEVLRFRNVERGIARARDAARAGRLDEAAQAYTAAIAGSPESAFLYRELAGVEKQKGDTDAALEHFRKAVSLDPDAKTFAQIGDLLDARGNLDAALKAYQQSMAIEPSADVEKRLEEVRAKAALAQLPAEYRAIDQAAQITRADLAALIGIRLGAMLTNARRGDAALITDVRNHWAATWIMSVARAGVMDPFSNHAFQPRTVIRRTDLAQAVARLLARMAAQNPARGKAWENARLKFSDLSPSHVAYPAASIAVASGVLKTVGENAFQPSRPVTGAEAIEAIARIQALAGSR